MALRAVIDHPKFFRLKNVLRLNKSCTLGYLEALWHFCGRYTPQGNIGKYSNEEIEAWLEWDGTAGALIGAFIQSRWIDASEAHRLVVHDWHQHADDATRKALFRAKLDFVSTPSGHVETPSEKPIPPSGLPGAEPVPEAVPEAEPEAGSVPVPRGARKGPTPLVQSMGWDETVAAAIRAGMAIDPSTESPFFKEVWSPGSVKDKAECVRGIYAGIKDGIFGPNADPQYVPAFRNYWKSRSWNEIRPRNRGQPPDKKQAAREQFDRLVMRDLEDAKIHSR